MLFNIEMSKFMRTWNCKSMSIWWDYYARVAGSESKQMTDESSCGWMVTKPQWLRDDVTHSRQEVEGWQCWEDSSTLSGNINNLTLDQHTDRFEKIWYWKSVSYQTRSNCSTLKQTNVDKNCERLMVLWYKHNTMKFFVVSFHRTQ